MKVKTGFTGFNEDFEENHFSCNRSNLVFMLLDCDEMSKESLINKGYDANKINELITQGVIFEPRNGFVRLVK